MTDRADTRRFFRYFLMLFLVHTMSVTMFRAIGGLARNLVVANACGSLWLLIILLMGGFVLAKRAPQLTAYTAVLVNFILFDASLLPQQYVPCVRAERGAGFCAGPFGIYKIIALHCCKPCN